MRAPFATALALTLLAGCSYAPPSRAAIKPAAKRNPAPPFTLKDATGKSFNLADYKGKVVLLNFWATWCGPCKLEIPWFIEFEKNYRDKGFAVLGISMDEEGWEVVKPYLDRAKINYRMAIGNDMMAQHYGGVESLPTSFLIDRDGKIAAVHVGLVSKGDYQTDIEQLVGASKRSDAKPRTPVVPASASRAVQ
jgi:cytochrome c biogenesis protein CcmG/thiol:disulfide interchange protein DsbE